jgi:hypothetical protein
MPRLGPPALRPPQIETHTGDDVEGGASEAGLQEKDRRKAFALHIFPSPDYKHKTNIRNSPLHGPWITEKSVEESFLYTAMTKSVKKGYDAPGLRDWQSAGQSGDDWEPVGEGKAAFSERRKERSEAAAKEKSESERVLTLLKHANEADRQTK